MRIPTCVGVDCCDSVGAADAKTAGTSHLLSSCLPLCERKTESGDQSGLKDLSEPVTANLKKAAAYGRVSTCATEFK